MFTKTILVFHNFCLYPSKTLFSKDIIWSWVEIIACFFYVQSWNMWYYKYMNVNIYGLFLFHRHDEGTIICQVLNLFLSATLCLFLFRADMSKQVNWLLSSAWMSQGWVYFHCTFRLDLFYYTLKMLRSFTDKMSKPLEEFSAQICRFILGLVGLISDVLLYPYIL